MCPHARPDWSTCPHCLGINGPLFVREMIRLKPGEARPLYALDDPPEGYRWETDDELRERIKKTLPDPS